MSKINYLIVGAGLYGATMARTLMEAGKTCLIIDKRSHIAGNIYSEETKSGIHKHVYGPHIFHTDNEDIWEFVNYFANWEPYQQNTLAHDGFKFYNLPFNAMTFYQIFGTDLPEKAYKKILDEIKESGLLDKKPTNLEEQAIKLVGKTIYEKLIKGYTEKQWGKPCTELDPEVIKRLPLRFSFNNNYFNDKYQAIPEEGYTEFVKNIIKGIPCMLNTEFDYSFWKGKVDNIIYCGAVDELLNYELGELEWRSLKFKDIYYDYNGYDGQGAAIINNVSINDKCTRMVDHMYFQPRRLKDMIGKEAVATCEYPINWERGKERYYPINNERNEELYRQYVTLLNEKMPEIILGGRLGKYRYFDMDDTIAEALQDAENILDNEHE